jgi:Histidine kinase-, DNA gyrase B-, and HSP90-like ATPase.
MFKLIKYELYFYILLLVITAAGLTYAAIYREYTIGAILLVLFSLCLMGLLRAYKKYDNNVHFILNALEKGNYSFHFSRRKPSREEREMSSLFNRIKHILAKARADVVEKEKFLTLIMDNIPTGIFIMDKHGAIKMVNQSALKLLELPSFNHINQLKVIDENCPEMFMTLENGDAFDLEISSDKEKQIISMHASELKSRKTTMRVISLYNITNEMENTETDSCLKLIDAMELKIKKGGKATRSLGRDMLTLRESYQSLRDNDLEKKKVSVLDLIDKALKPQESALLEKRITALVDVREKGLSISADEGLAIQAITNLLENAMEAVENLPSKRVIRITAYKNNKIVKIEVANYGDPIPEELHHNLFIPFFSTKPDKSGIGLSISRQIMRLHNGRLQHATTARGLTEFTMVFPAPY